MKAAKKKGSTALAQRGAYQRALSQAAMKLARLRLQRRGIVKRLATVDAEIREARRALRMMADDAWPEVKGGVPTGELLPGEGKR